MGNKQGKQKKKKKKKILSQKCWVCVHTGDALQNYCWHLCHDRQPKISFYDFRKGQRGKSATSADIFHVLFNKKPAPLISGADGSHLKAATSSEDSYSWRSPQQSHRRGPQELRQGNFASHCWGSTVGHDGVIRAAPRLAAHPHAGQPRATRLL